VLRKREVPSISLFLAVNFKPKDSSKNILACLTQHDVLCSGLSDRRAKKAKSRKLNEISPKNCDGQDEQQSKGEETGSVCIAALGSLVVVQRKGSLALYSS